MSYTLGTAAKATGKSKTTIKRAIEKGRISAKKDEKGEWDIDPAELHRIYKAVTGVTVTSNSNEKLENNRGLQAENEALRERLKEKDGIIEDLRQDRDEWREQSKAAQRLLEHQREKSSQRNVERFRERLGRWIAGKS